MDIKLAVVKGDGIGPEIIEEAEKILNRIGELYGHCLLYTSDAARAYLCLYGYSGGRLCH